MFLKNALTCALTLISRLEREKMSRVFREFKKVLEGALWGREFNVIEKKEIQGTLLRKLKSLY